MKYFLFHNTTVERFFQHLNVDFSGYENISTINTDADRYIWFYLAPIAENRIVAEKIRDYTNMVRMTIERIPQGKMFIACTIKDIFTIQGVSSDRAVADTCPLHEGVRRHAGHGRPKLMSSRSPVLSVDRCAG
jgi:hypothetical protein